MELISWNVNGLRSCIEKGFDKWVKLRKPDFLCIQEIKVQPIQLSLDLILPEYNIYWNSAKKKGYSGVAILSKTKPLKISKVMGYEEYDDEGRFLQLEFDSFYLINLYFPNAQRELKRIDFKLKYNDNLLNYIENLRKDGKGIILCGDFNVAHQEIDLKNPKTNQNNAGFTSFERDWFSKLLDSGYIDTFRYFNSSPEQYSWWTYRNNARERNIGWRIDYFVINREFLPKLKSAFILQDVLGSDHAPVGIIIEC